MAIQLSPTTQTTTKEYRVTAFQINTPHNLAPSVDVYYGEILYGETGNVLTFTPNIVTLKLAQSQLVSLLPANNAYALPKFSSLYTGLRGLLDDQFKANFSGQFLS